jgi:8-oxo-dGTP pyrophosphatase MutT (NUDIX family)
MDPPDDLALAWKIVRRERVSEHGVFSVSELLAQHITSQNHKKFSVISCPDWVNVMCLTPDDDLVLVRQFRPGVEQVTLEIPGGVVDPGEDPLHGAMRELSEETGYEAKRWFELGTTAPNPALQSNTCHHWLALDAAASTVRHPDPDEQISVLTCPLARVPDLVRKGEISHALVLAAFARFALHAGGWHRPSFDV